MANAVSSFFHPEAGYDDAMKQLQQYFQQAQGGLNPFIQNGMNAGNNLSEQEAALNDPAALQAKWAQGYSESPYAQQLTKQATSSGLNAASSMGLMGSSAALGNIQNSAGNIMQSDRQNYLNDLMQKYMASIGIGQNLYGVGAGAQSQQSQNAMNMGENMAGLQYGATNAPGDMFGKLAGGVADLGLNWATGGLKGVADAASKMYAGGH
jgi:hypothetical protein